MKDVILGEPQMYSTKIFIRVAWTKKVSESLRELNHTHKGPHCNQRNTLTSSVSRLKKGVEISCFILWPAF